jgi:transposase InsO family protein
MKKEVDLGHQEALQRFHIIAPLLDPEMERMAGRVWRTQICERAGISERTLRRWMQAYRENGLEGLYPKERSDKGSSRALSTEALELARELRKELPERSAERLCELLESKGHKAKRSTLERQLRLDGFSARMLKRERTSTTVGRRFQHEHRNSLWQTDFKVAGIYLPDPQRPGKKLPTYLLVFLDDATRKVIHAEFYFDQTTFTLMDGLRKAILSAGCPRSIYLDNGKQFTSTWMQLVCARLGIRHQTTQIYSAESKGKVERFNRTIEEFIREVRLESPQSLLALNQKLRQWVMEGYNRRKHSALDEKHPSPEEAYASNSAPLRMVAPETLRVAFLWEDERTVDKAGCVQLNGKVFDTGLNLIRKKVVLRYDPLDLSQVEVFYQGISQGFSKPVQIGAFNGVRRRSRGNIEEPARPAPATSAVLQMLAQKEQRRFRSDAGAFMLSQEEGEDND